MEIKLNNELWDMILKEIFNVSELIISQLK